MRTLIPFLMILSASSLHAADTYCANDTTPLPDGTGSAVRSFVVPAGSGPLSLTGVRATVAIVHPWVGDLRVVLRHPSGVEVVLLDRPGVVTGGGSGLGFPGPWGCGGGNVDVTFDDAALLDAEGACETAGTAVVGTKRPLEQLASFNGLSPVGTWTLIASDLIPIDAYFFRVFLEIQARAALLMTIAIGPGIISGDIANNALPLYLARPLSRAEYALGKMTTVFALLSAITWVPGLLLFGFAAYLEGFAWFAENFHVGVGNRLALDVA